MTDTSATTFKWDVNEHFQSNLITPDNALKQWKDEHRFKGYFYKDYDTFLWGLYTDSWLLFDKQQARQNEFSNHAAGLFSTIYPASNIIIKPYAGYQRAKNISKTDWGWDVGLSGKAANMDLGDYTGSFSAESDYDFYEQRQNYNNSISAGVSTQFSAFTRDSLYAGYEESSKQFYNNAGDQIIEVKLYNRNIRNQLYYALSQRHVFNFETNILSKNVTYFNNRNVFFLENALRYNYFGKDLSYQVNFHTNDETMNNDGTITDSRTRQSALGFKTFYRINSSNSLNIDIAYVKLQYDTPDESNNDDRDEQRYIINVHYSRKLSPVLNLNVSAYGFLFHQIYLFSEQSINNNWNRVIKLKPQLVYSYKNFENRISSSVIANYTAYDFDNLFVQSRSYLSRKYTLSDSLAAPVINNFSLGFQGRLELEEKGSFFKKNFAQNIIQSYTSYNYNIYVMRTLYQRFNFRLGYSFFNRTEWRHIPKKTKNREITNRGPFFNIIYSVVNRISLSAYAAINYIDDSKSRKDQYNTGYLKLIYNL